MTEIEKMFENANAYKILCNCEFKNLYDFRIEYGSDVCDYTESEIKEPCKVCEKAKQKIKYYPDFTAEKQLELIKWFAKIYELSINWDEQYNSYRFVIRNYQQNGRLNHSVCSYEEPFEETLAYLINRIWQDLTDKEKEEIRGILNE